jgi:hypothetical protein
MIINSVKLVSALKNAIGYYPGDLFRLFLSFKAVKVPAPYMVPFHNRKKIQEATGKAEGLTKDLLNLVLDYLKMEQPTTWQKLDELEAGTCKRLSFGYIWLAYTPGTTVYGKKPNDEDWQTFKIEQIITIIPTKGVVIYPPTEPISNLKKLAIRCFYLDFDHKGRKLIPQAQMYTILPFSSKRAIADMEMVPESVMGQKDEIRQSLLSRGQTYNSLHVSEYLQSRKTVATTCSCSICFLKYALLWSYYSDDWDDSRICPDDPCTQVENSTDDARRKPAPQESLLFCPPEIWAFSLIEKPWGRVRIEELHEILPNPNPFRRLVLDPEYKDIGVAMVEDHLNKGKGGFSDLIKGKGRGLVLLLHGGPGTGKTLTVGKTEVSSGYKLAANGSMSECVAEHENMPLYMVTCGDLGTEPDDLVERLRNIFLVAVHWNAILLLDEADVFLQERDIRDLRRNALVSIFLWHLEYYDGVFFLSTNRPGQLHEAFQSRIHITLGLPDLDFDC